MHFMCILMRINYGKVKKKRTDSKSKLEIFLKKLMVKFK